MQKEPDYGDYKQSSLLPKKELIEKQICFGYLMKNVKVPSVEKSSISISIIVCINYPKPITFFVIFR